MNLNSLKNKKIGILGLGIENQALVKYLLKHRVKCEMTICDKRLDVKMKIKNAGLRVPPPPPAGGLGRTSKPTMTGSRIHWQLGKNFNKDLDKFDILFRSPGWPMDCPGIKEVLKQAKSPLSPFVKGGIILSSPMKLFFELCPTRNIIGVTGTKGKGTTASLIYEILKRAGKRTWLGGNIGLAPFAFIDKIKKNDWLVLELSSFQLEDLTVSPLISVITNLSPEHLALDDSNNPNYHKSLESYYNAKLNIIKYQKRGDKAILNYELRITPLRQAFGGQANYELNTKAKIVYFKKSDFPSKLIGEHNKENVGAAVAVAKIVGVGQGVVKKAVADFKGLEHRLEFVREYKQIKYYEDSSATTPAAVMVALKSFSSPLVLLLGGADKGSDFKELALEAKKRCKFVVLLNGKATPRIKTDLLKIGFSENKIKSVNNIKEAVAAARRQAISGDVILLSTACASFGMFKNYKERGDLFKKEVLKIRSVK